MKKRRALIGITIALSLSAAVFFMAFGAFRASYPLPYRQTVEESGVDFRLVYSVMKAESGFRENAVSRAGAVGIMQIKPSTAEFVCRRAEIPFEPERLTDGAYNTQLGCLYLAYLLEKFPAQGTALAAYNAGEGTVSEWLQDPAFSEDGEVLKRIPYPETEEYVKKIVKFMKIYEFFYG